MTSLVGKSLQNGKYFLRQELGRGISDVTYEAVNQVLKQPVVIKTLQLALAQETYLADLRKKFLDEARRLVKCSHPNIIQFREFFVEDGLPYIVMDYIPGATLDKLVQPGKPLPEAVAVYYIRQVGEALKVVHENGLLHRDIKPQNLVLRQDTQQVILNNFGIAREFLPGAIQTHTSLTSEGYAPIEQYLTKTKRTPASDIYGLAATLYTLLTGQIPVAATLRSQVPLASPKEIRPEISEMVSFAVMQGMALKPERRPSSVKEWLALLPEVKRKNKSVSLEPNGSTDPQSFKENRPENIAATSSPKQSSKRDRTLKILFIVAVVGLALDYAWLKFRDRFQNRNPQPNTQTSPAAQPAVPRSTIQTPPVGQPAVPESTIHTPPGVYSPAPESTIHTPPGVYSPAPESTIHTPPAAQPTVPGTR